MNIEYVGFHSLCFKGKRLCVMCVFSIVSFCSFIENMFGVNYCTRLKSTFGIKYFLASGGIICGQGFGSGL
jgi:hypothetical protein